jgi:tripartite-type tricarboxylate transporter receptor subunit TctC
MKTRSFLKLATLALWLPFGRVIAQSAATIRVIVPLGPGTANDLDGRLLLAKVGSATSNDFVIDNRPGANGVIAAMAVVRAKPDGQTLLFSSNSALATNVSLVKALPYDPLKDFTPIAGGSITATAVIVKASSSFKTFAELIAAARQSPGKITFGHGSSFVQVQVANINTKGGVQLMGVPYKTTGDAVTGVLSGVVDVTITDPGNAMALAKGGQVRILAVTSLKRNTALPDVPAIAETIPGHDFVAWAALVGPAGMPRDVVERLGKAMRDAQADPEIIERLRNGGRAPLVLGPDELKSFMAAEVQKWEVLVREAKIEPI